MTISVYSRRGDATALEIHLHDPTVLSDWLLKNVTGYSAERGLISIDVNGVTVTDFSSRIFPADDVRIYPVAGTIMQAIQLGLLLFSVVYALTRKAPESEYETGTALAVANTRAVNASPGEVIRETLGCCRSYPDYVVQQTMRFTSPYNYYVYMYVSLGTGTYSHNAEDILVGDTPVSSFDADYTFYAANASVKNDERTENWYNCANVGATTSASGLDLNASAPGTETVEGGSVTVSGPRVTVNSPNVALTSQISTGQMLTIRVPVEVNVTFASENGTAYDWILVGSDAADELNFSAGDAVTVIIDQKEYDVWVQRVITDSSSGKPVGYTFSLADPTSEYFSSSTADSAAFPWSWPRATFEAVFEPQGCQYMVTSVNSSTILVSQYVNGELSSWNGFSSRTNDEFYIDYVNTRNVWLGPFVATPEGEAADALEVNFTFPNGLIDYNDEGEKKSCEVTLSLGYSLDGGVSWNTRDYTYRGKYVDGIGFTERITFSASKNVQVRCRRLNEAGKKNRRDTCYWQALRTRLTTRPLSYPVPTFALTLRSGGMLAANSERQLSLKLTRQYTRGAEISISGAVYCVLQSLNIPDSMIDYDTIDALEESVWTPAGYHFNSTLTSADSAWNMLTMILQAAGSYPLLKNGVFSAGYTGVKEPVCAFTPQDYAGDGLTVTYQTPSRDDYNAVDVTWTDQELIASVVECRSSQVTEEKTESWVLSGVTDLNIAWQLGMRRLLSYRYQRTSFSFTTELLAMNCGYGDVVLLFDDIPVGDDSHRSALILEHRHLDDGSTYLLLSEPLNDYWKDFWGDAVAGVSGITASVSSAIRVLIRYPDGTVSGLMPYLPNNGTTMPEEWADSRYVLHVETQDAFSLLERQNDAEEPARVVVMLTENAGYKAIIQSVEPQPDGTVNVTAVEYDERVYANDGKAYPG